jgi:hypothetical protein
MIFVSHYFEIIYYWSFRDSHIPATCTQVLDHAKSYFALPAPVIPNIELYLRTSMNN